MSCKQLFAVILFLSTLVLALPMAFAADNAAPVKVLLIGGQGDHDWATTNEFLRTLLKRSGGFVVTTADAPAANDKVETWDAWVPPFAENNVVVVTYHGQAWPQKTRTAFEQYISGGGSALFLHAACGGQPEWPALDSMIGLLNGADKKESMIAIDAGGKVSVVPAVDRPGESQYFDWTVTVRDTDHPITNGMPTVWQHANDQMFHHLAGPAQDLHVLLSAMSGKEVGGSGREEPVLWWVSSGKGKVMTNIMGRISDGTASLACVGFQTTFLRSLTWLANDVATTIIPSDFPTATKISMNFPGLPVKRGSDYYSPNESMQRIKLPPGYRLELMASEPNIISPVACAWDGNGNMYVCEMRTYMLDADSTGQNEPKSRVSRLSDTNGDGTYDKITIFADNLVLPRMVLPLGDRVMIMETFTGKMVSYRDTNGDGIADENFVAFENGPSQANMEHQDSAPLWGIDNYIYTAFMGNRRLKVNADGKFESDPIVGSNSQWGLAMDDTGRLFASAGGRERGAYGFQQLPQYGDLELPGEINSTFSELFPAVQMVDVQGGWRRIKPIDGTINHITACAGQAIFRGDNMAPDLVGDYILPEPVGRLVRRAKVDRVNGKYVLSNFYPGDEFITSTDMNFRPVWAATGPDGCLYILDMNRGIIQEGNWVKPNSYLREPVLREGFDKNINHGRIYRVAHDSTKPAKKPNMLNETSAELVAHLSHANGWWRDMAQQLIVLRRDVSVVPALKSLATTGTSALGRLHALWTLSGLEANDKDLLMTAFKDSDWRVRAGAVRISEFFLKQNDVVIQAALAPLARDPSGDVVVQVVNSMRYFKSDQSKMVIMAAVEAHPGNDIIMASSKQSLLFAPGQRAQINVKLDEVTMERAKKGHEYYAQICFACHGKDGKGVTTEDGMTLAPPLSGSARVNGSVDGLARIVMHGLLGEVDGKMYPGLMVPMGANDDEWFASVLTYIRLSYGNTASPVTPAEIARVRSDTKEQTGPFTLEALKPFLKIDDSLRKTWKASASENDEKANAIIDGKNTRWSTTGDMAKGMWVQIDMDKVYQLSSLMLDSGNGKDYPRQFEVTISMDGTSWSQPVFSGAGKGGISNIALPKGTEAKYLRVTLTEGARKAKWALVDMSFFGMAK
jgi:putative membrane-bound dehydrogenase-like protein